jgi:protein TonB
LKNQYNNLPSIGGILSDNKLASSSGNSWRLKRFFADLFTKYRTIDMMALVAILVLLLHGIGLIWLRSPLEQKIPANPIMEVTIIPVSAPKPKVAPPPPPAKTKLHPKKTQPKPTLKKMPVVQEPADFAPTKQAFESQPIVQNALVMATAANQETTAKIEPFIEADINADYAENPKPNYPSIARGMGWQGKVMLRVQVSDQGLSDAVEIERSSGYDILDESALEAIKQWRFTPAKRGETPITSSVIVPIIFTLQDQNQS